jgi:hypothetical protein
MNKICRICWNTRDWRQPTGEAAKLEKGGTTRTYVQTQGYGLEEWIFNFSWLHRDGNKYGYLQPIAKYRSKYEGTTFNILVYARNPNKEPCAIAELHNVTVLTLEEAASAINYMKQNHWLREMEQDLEQIPFAKALPKKSDQIVNIKFDPERVRFYEPFRVFPKGHQTRRNVRYQPLNWTDRRSQAATLARRSTSTKQKSEDEVIRKAVAATAYNPVHNKIQNAMKVLLSRMHGAQFVKLDDDGVDVVLNLDGTRVFYEVKTHPTAKACIRDALGQLLEYAVYPKAKRADRLVVVGDGKPTREDAQYLRHLRAHLPLPVHYATWNWKDKRLEPEC